MSATDFLHGVETIDVDDGTRPIQTVRSSVIGVVGTAPDSAPEVKAVLTLGSAASKNAIDFTAKPYGAQGNEVAVHIKNPKANSQTLSITIAGKIITASVATDETGAVTTTAAQLLAAIDANVDAVALVGSQNTAGSDGTGVVSTYSRPYYLTGGTDEPFPLNTPVLVTGLVKAGALGKAGTLPQAATGIYKQTGAVCIFVRVDEGEDEAETMQNIIGGTSVDGSYTGMYAFLKSTAKLGFCPRILIANGFTHQRPEGRANPVVAELQGIANRLRAVVVKDGTNTTDAAAFNDRSDYGSKRVYYVESFVTIMQDGEIINVPGSPYVAGLGARIDNEKGFWKSWSNEEIFGIIGTAREIEYQTGDTNSQANLLNEQEIAVITRIEETGFRLWGNRTTSADPKWSFLSRVRIADMVNESILRNHLWAVDRSITKTYFGDVVAGVNAYMKRLRMQGAIAGGECWADKEWNPKESIFNGQAVFCYEFSDSPPAERVTFRSKVSDRFLEELL